MNYHTLKYLISILLLLILVICPQIFAKDAFDEPALEMSYHDEKQIQCLADNIYYEARGEPYLGKVAVARVVMNRVEHQEFADTPCDVIYKHAYVNRTVDDVTKKVKVCQFSWTCTQKRKVNEQDPQYITALKIAQKVFLSNAYDDIIPKTILFFHSASIQPNWGYRYSLKIGNHIFYSRNRR